MKINEGEFLGNPIRCFADLHWAQISEGHNTPNLEFLGKIC